VPHRKPQVRYRFDRDLIRKIEAAAKRSGRPINEEVERRLNDSFVFENWREDQERWRLALDTMLNKPLLSAEEVTKMRDDLEDDNDSYLNRDRDVREVKRTEE